jgi:hypothetical protein
VNSQTDERDELDAPDVVEDFVEATSSAATRGERIRRWADLRRGLLIRLAIAVVVVTTITLVNSAFIGWGTAVTAAILAVPTSRFRSYTVAFMPYALAWLIFSLLRALADETPVGLRTEQVTDIERWLFGGHIPTIWLQERLFDPTHIAWYDYATTFIHWSYFVVPHILGIIIWRRSPELYRRYLMTTILTMGVGLVIYFLSPAAPPWLTADRAPQQDIFRVMANVGRSLNSSLYDRTYSVLGDPNPVAAMPSLHEAITFIVFLFATKFGWKWGVAGFLYAIAMAFSLAYTGEHYVIDTLVGAAIATYAFYFSGFWLRVTAPLFRQIERRATGRAATPGKAHA